MVMTALLHRKTPLVAQVHFADSFGAPRAIDFARARIPFLRSAAVLDTAAIAYEIIACRLSFSVVARA